MTDTKLNLIAGDRAVGRAEIFRAPEHQPDAH